MATQNEILLQHLKAGNIVTTRTAPDELGMADVRANIRDLRDAGHNILDRWVKGINRYGRPTRYKEYYIKVENYCGECKYFMYECIDGDGICGYHTDVAVQKKCNTKSCNVFEIKK